MNLHVEIKQLFKKHVHFVHNCSYDILAGLVMTAKRYSVFDIPPVYFIGPKATGKTVARNIIDLLTDGRMVTYEFHRMSVSVGDRSDIIRIFTSITDYDVNFTEFGNSFLCH